MLNEKKLSKAELDKREDIIMKMKKNKSALVKKYGKDAEKVMYGRATNIAKKQAESMENTKIKEMIKSALMGPMVDPEVGEDRYREEQDLATVSHALDQLEAKLKAHDWYYMMSDDHRVYTNGRHEQSEIRSIMDDLEGLGYGKDAKDLYNQYAPHKEGGPSFRMKEAKGKDMDKDGDIDSDDYLAARDAAIKKAKGEVKEDGVGDVIDPAEYGDIGAAYLKGFNKPHSLNLDQLETLGRKIVKQLYKGDFKAAKAKFLSETVLNEDKVEALMELRNILDELQVLGDQARNIIKENFPSFLSKGEAYGAFDMGSSSNRYDTTLASIVADIEEYGDEEDEDMMQEDMDLGHQDNEPHMLKGDLYRIGKYAMELYQMVDGFEGKGEVDFPHWWQSKIIKAKDYLVGAKHYLDFEVKEPQIDAMVDVAQDVEAIDEAAGKFVVRPCSNPGTPFAVWQTSKDGENDKRIEGFKTKEDAQKFADEKNSLDEANVSWSTIHSEPTRSELIAVKIQKAMNAHRGDDVKMYQLQAARRKMNLGDLDRAEEIADRYLEEDIDEGVFDRVKAKVAGAAAGATQAVKNVGAAIKGDKDALKSTAVASGMAKLKVKAKSLDKDLVSVQNDINKLFPTATLEKNPKLKAVIDQYKAVLQNTKNLNTQIASGEVSGVAPKSSNSTTDNAGESGDKKTGTKAKFNNQVYDVFQDAEGNKYVNVDGKQIPVGGSGKEDAKKGPVRDEKGRFVTNKKPDIKPELIDNNYEMTKKIYSYKGKNYQVQMDKKTKEEFFKHEDGRVMDIAQINKNAKVKKPAKPATK